MYSVSGVSSSSLQYNLLPSACGSPFFFTFMWLLFVNGTRYLCLLFLGLLLSSFFEESLSFIRLEPFLCVEILSFMGKRLNFNANSNSIPTYSHSLSIFSGSGSAPATDVSCTYLSWSYSSIFDEFLLPENLISLFDNVFFNVILLSLLTFHITLPSYTSFIFNIRVFFSWLLW